MRREHGHRLAHEQRIAKTNVDATMILQYHACVCVCVYVRVCDCCVFVVFVGMKCEHET